MHIKSSVLVVEKHGERGEQKQNNTYNNYILEAEGDVKIFIWPLTLNLGFRGRYGLMGASLIYQ